VKDLVGWIGAHCAWKVVRQHGGWINFESAVRGQRHCHWGDGSSDPIDCKLMRSGDAVRGPFKHVVLQ
jgi:hypothetical protein